MTTTTSCFDWRFFALVKGNLRRSFGGMVYTFILTFFFFPVQYLLEIFSVRFTDPALAAYAGYGFSLYGPARIYTPLSIVVMTMILLVTPIAAGVSHMHYMHSRRSVDLYHSLPVTRRQLMLSGGLTALLVTAIPMAANYLIVFGAGFVRSLTLPAGSFPFHPLEILLDALGWGVTHLFVIAVIMLVASQVGSAFENFVFSVELLSAPFVVVAIIQGLCQAFLLGFTGGLSLTELSHLTPLAMMIRRYTLSTTMWTDQEALSAEMLSANLTMLFWFVLGVAILLLALRMYSRRKSELAETSGMAGPLGFLSRAVLVFIGAAAIGTIFSAIRSFGETPFVIWSFVGAVLTFFLMEAVFNRGFKGIRKSLPAGGVMVVAVLAVNLAIVGGGLGYENRIPATEKVESVTINTRGRFDHVTYLDAEAAYNYTSYDQFGNRVTYYRHGAITTATLTDPQAIDIVRQIHEATIAWNRQNTGSYYGYSASADYESRISSFDYRLGSGSLKRQYSNWGTGADVRDLYWQLEAQPDFVRQTCPLFFLSPEDFKAVTLSEPTGLLAGDPTSDGSAIRRLVEALQADILADDLATIRMGSAKVLGYLYFDTGVAATDIYSLVQPLERNMAASFSIRIYEGYDNTLALLAVLGMNAPLTGEPPEIAGFWLSDMSMRIDAAYYSQGPVAEQSYYADTFVDDPEQVAALRALMRIPVPLGEQRDCLYLVPVDGEGKEGNAFVVPLAVAPDFALDLFPYLRDSKATQPATAALVAAG